MLRILVNALQEIGQHLDVVTEALRSEIRTVAEAVSSQGEEFRRELTRVRSGIEEVKSMIPLEARIGA